MKIEIASGKMVLAGVLAVVMIIATGSMASAGISKTTPWDDAYCNLCHTGGTATDGTTNQTCVDCHSHPTSSTVYVLSGGGGSATVPVVNYTGASLDSNDPILAGGNFFWVQTEDSKGHNIFAANPDGDLTDGAPGDQGPGDAPCGGPTSCHANFDTTTNFATNFL